MSEIGQRMSDKVQWRVTKNSHPLQKVSLSVSTNFCLKKYRSIPYRYFSIKVSPISISILKKYRRYSIAIDRYIDINNPAIECQTI